MHVATLGHCVFQGSLHIITVCVIHQVAFVQTVTNAMEGKTAFTKKRNVYSKKLFTLSSSK